MVTREEIVWCYRAILGRVPESEEVITQKLQLENFNQLRKIFLNSSEFKNQNGFGFTNSKWVAVDILDCYTQWIDLSDNYVSKGCLNNSWEPSETDYFISKLEDQSIVFDIGANIGWFTLVAAKHIGDEGAIYAFEPRPETAKMLKRTLTHNKLDDRVHLWNYALLDKWEELNLYSGFHTDNPGGSFVFKGEIPSSNQEAIKVKAAPLDELLPNIFPDIIKIDVEGAEPLVFKGAKILFKVKKPPILSELHPSQLMKVSNATSYQYIDQMKSYGYSCYLLENGQPTQKINDYPAVKKDLLSVVFE
ncbi:MAG: FkbM family methyltransferase [Verrucomicrobia bacterium]|nr:MAG: FkbM family methyltransferase [Verrucomicrobiota bacterium]